MLRLIDIGSASHGHDETAAAQLYMSYTDKDGNETKKTVDLTTSGVCPNLEVTGERGHFAELYSCPDGASMTLWAPHIPPPGNYEQVIVDARGVWTCKLNTPPCP
jgi:hypothetical protein